jgi:hypothetical protein
MAKGTPTTEQFQHFVSTLRESFWGDVYGRRERRGSSFGRRIRLGSAIDLR